MGSGDAAVTLPPISSPRPLPKIRPIDDFLILGIVAAVFGRTLGFGFVDWDDLIYTITNPLVKHPLSEGPAHLLLTPRMGYPVPLTVILRHLAFRVGGGDAWPFHLSNLLFQGGSALLAARLLAGWGLARRAAVAAAALWAVHPIVVEPVAWVTGGKDVVAGTFMLAGLLAFRRTAEADGGRTEGAWAAGFVVANVLGIAAKPTAAILPVLAVAEALVFRRRLRRPLIAALAVSFAVAVAGAVAAYLLHDRHGGHPVRPLGDRLLFATQHLALQLRHYAAPVALAARYPEGFPRPLASAWGAAGIAALGGFVVAGAAALRRRTAAPLWLWSLGLLTIAFLPASGVLALSRGSSDSYFYLPSLALAAAVALGGERLCRGRRLLASGWPMAALVAVLAFASFVQTGVWRSSLSLWTRQVEVYPDSDESWVNYGDALIEAGRIRDAMAAYEHLLARFPYPPPDVSPLLNLGQGWSVLGDGARATRWYGEVVRHYPLTPARALRLIGAAAVHTDARYEGEARRARNLIERSLSEIAAAPPAERDARTRAFFDHHLSADRLALAALRVLVADARLGGVAALLLDIGRSTPPVTNRRRQMTAPR